MTSISAGSSHTCVLRGDGAVKCFGYGGADIDAGGFGVVPGVGRGRLGTGDTLARGDEPNEMGDNLTAIDVGSGRTVTSISAGQEHTCVLLDDGTVKCFGGEGYGRLGTGDAFDRGDDPNEMGDNLPAIDVGSGRTVTRISAGPFHTCVLLDDGTVKCFGIGLSGRIGTGDTEDRGDDPNEMGDNLTAIDVGSGRTVVSISAGGFHTMRALGQQGRQVLRHRKRRSPRHGRHLGPRR